jgi:hypothetical protein
MEAAIRPGCVHLGIDITLRSPADREATTTVLERNFLATITEESSSKLPWCRFDTDVFLPSSIIKASHRSSTFLRVPRIIKNLSFPKLHPKSLCEPYNFVY